MCKPRVNQNKATYLLSLMTAYICFFSNDYPKLRRLNEIGTHDEANGRVVCREILTHYCRRVLG